MTKMLFVSLPVADLAASTAFYEALGFERNPQLCDDTGACMVWSEAIQVMLITDVRTPGSPYRESDTDVPAQECSSASVGVQGRNGSRKARHPVTAILVREDCYSHTFVPSSSVRIPRMKTSPCSCGLYLSA